MIIIFSGHPKTLDEFTYDDKDINDIIVECMSNTSMVGIQGSIAFGEGGDPIRNVKIERVQGNKICVLNNPLGDTTIFSSYVGLGQATTAYKKCGI